MTENITPAAWSTQQLIAVRAQLNLSRKDLSDLTGLTQAVIWRIEHVEVGAEKDADADIRTKMQTALADYVVTNPGGKPKAEKKAPKAAKPTTGVDKAQVLELLHRLAQIAEEEFAVAKGKKSYTAGFSRLLVAIDTTLDTVANDL